MCAGEISRGKPDLEGYLTAAARLGRAPVDCVLIDDTPAGLEAARAAGMRSIGIAGTYPASALTVADLVVPSVAELPGDLVDRVISRGV